MNYIEIKIWHWAITASPYLVGADAKYITGA